MVDVAAICPSCPRAGTFHSPSWHAEADGLASASGERRGLEEPCGPSSRGWWSGGQGVGDSDRLVAVDAEAADAERAAPDVALLAALGAEEALLAARALVDDQVSRQPPR